MTATVLRILTAAERIRRRRADGQVRLAALRIALSDIPRPAIVLSRDDNTAQLTAADHDAALLVGSGAPRHLFYVRGWP